MSTKIKLPKIYTSRFKDKLKQISEKGKKTIAEWAGFDIFVNIFMIYLLKKYKSSCLKTATTTISFDITEKNDNVTRQQIKTFCNKIFSCLTSKNKTATDNIILIPLTIILQGEGEQHQNLLIYRKDTSTLEHFEPHGVFSSSGADDSKIIKRQLNILVNELNIIMDKSYIKHTPVKLINPEDICPNFTGFQKIESLSTLPIKTGGFCVVWSLFFAELVLSNPTLSSKEIHDQILLDFFNNESSKKKTYDFFRNLINGYTLLLDEKLVKYFSMFYGKDISIKKITDILENYKKKNNKDNPDTDTGYDTDYETDVALLIQIHKDIVNISNHDINNLGWWNRLYQLEKPPSIFSNITSLSTSNSNSFEEKEKERNKLSVKKKRCPNGSRRNKKTSGCDDTKKREGVNKKRCPNGTRKNKKTGECDKK